MRRCDWLCLLILHTPRTGVSNNYVLEKSFLGWKARTCEGQYALFSEPSYRCHFHGEKWCHLAEILDPVKERLLSKNQVYKLHTRHHTKRRHSPHWHHRRRDLDHFFLHHLPATENSTLKTENISEKLRHWRMVTKPEQHFPHRKSSRGSTNVCNS